LRGYDFEARRGGAGIMGRKAISGVPKTETPLRIRLTAEERALLDAASEGEGKPTSTWARDVVLAAAARLAKARPKGPR